MFLRATIRWKDGKEHRYWSVVESRRVAGKRVVQRPLLYLGEINDSQRAAWRKSIAVLEDGKTEPRTLSLFPDDRAEGLLADDSIVHLRLSELSLRRPRQWGACWLALHLWEELHLDQFWLPRLPASRKGTRWDQVLFVLTAYRLIAPGSEWRLYRQWFAGTALGDLLGTDADLAEIHKLYACHDRLLAHKDALFRHLQQRWRDLFNADFDVLLYDLTSTYFEANPPFPEGDKRRFGYSRDHRPDCAQVVIALVVTPDGLPMAYEVMAGNTNDSRTLRDFLAHIERLYGKARRIWLMDRGIPTEAVLEEMRASDPPVQYLVGTPKGRLTRLQQRLLQLPWQQARPGVQVKLLSEDNELYVFAESEARVAKERAMRQRQLKWLWARLKQLTDMDLSREELLMRPGVECVAAGRGDGRRQSRAFHGPAAPREAAPRPLARRSLFASHQSAERRSGEAVGLLHSTDRGGAGVQSPEGRSGDPSGVPPERSPDRGTYLYCLPGLQPARDIAPEATGIRAGPDATRRTRRLRRGADDRCPRADDRRARADVDSIHRAGTRIATAARHAEATTPGSAAAQNHRRSGTAANPDVVKTF